jgi:hypothetical protein
MRGRHEHCSCTRDAGGDEYDRGSHAMVRCRFGESSYQSTHFALRRRLYGLHDKQTIGDFYLAISWGQTAEYQWGLSRGHG